MTIKIDRKIIKYQVQKPEDKPQDKPADKASEARAAPAKAASEARIAAEARVAQRRETELVRDKNGHTAKVIRMHAQLERPEVLVGSTYKIKAPISDHALDVTINDIVLNEGFYFEQNTAYEIFINSKNLDHFQWIVALTRIISAVFRKGGDVTFLVDELKAVFDPRGGYWQPGGKFMPSIIAELGYVIEKHLQSIGLIRKTQLDPHQQKLVDQKRAEFQARARQADAFAKPHFPEGAQLCGRCSTAAVVMMDGCMTCLNCGDSKCG